MSEHRLRRDVGITMRDGVRLAADLHLPGVVADGVRVPTLLQRTPYDRTDPHETQTMACLPIARALEAGFAVVVQDCRGRYASEGDFEPFATEADDGADTLAWIRAQPFSDGHVFGYGPSYVGAVQFLLGGVDDAAGVDAIAPAVTSTDPRREWAGRGGATSLGFLLLWLVEALAPHDLQRRGVPAHDPRRRLLAELLADPDTALDRLPVLDPVLEEIAPWLPRWIEAARAGGATPEPPAVPALHIAGLHDVFVADSLAAYAAMCRGPAGPDQYLVLGPWTHAERGEWQGEVWHGRAASAGAVDLAGRQLELFAAVAAGRRPRLPAVLHFVTGANHWREAEQWPPPARDRVFHLGGTDTGTGVLAVQVPDPTTVAIAADPADPVPTRGGATFLPGMATGRNVGPRDQRTIEQRDDVAVFRSAPLDADLDVVGTVRVELWGSGAPMTDDEAPAGLLDWAVRLVDVDRDGVPRGIADGIRRVPLDAVPRAVEVDLGPVSHRFAAGHRLGLQVAGSNHPRFDRAPHTDVDPLRATAQHLRAVRQTVHLGGAHPSRLLVPVPTTVRSETHDHRHHDDQEHP